MMQHLNATDRVSEEVLSVVVRVSRPDGNSEVLSEIFVAPTSIVRAFAEFLSHRDDDETFAVKKSKVKFADVSVSCGDSNRAIHAFECFRHYNMPLGNYHICAELIKDSEDSDDSDAEQIKSEYHSSLSISHDLDWTTDKNFQRFKHWYRGRQST